MQRKNGIDLFRLLGALFIMILHTRLGDINVIYEENIRLLCRWAVPFYFMTSGYFLGPKIVNNTLEFRSIEKNIIMLISILLISFIVYLPIAPARYSIENLLIGNFYHLWFIGSLLFGYIFVWYLYHIDKPRMLLFLSFGILIMAIISDSYDDFFNKKFDFIFFRFLLAIPFLYIGIKLSQINFKLKFSKTLLVFLIFASLVFQHFEANFLNLFFNINEYTIELSIGTILVSVGIFVFSTNINIAKSRLTDWGRDHSLFIYLFISSFLIFHNSCFFSKIFSRKNNYSYHIFANDWFFDFTCNGYHFKKIFTLYLCDFKW